MLRRLARSAQRVAALLRKDPEFYGPLFPGALAADPELPYVWPARAS